MSTPSLIDVPSVSTKTNNCPIFSPYEAKTLDRLHFWMFVIQFVAGAANAVASNIPNSFQTTGWYSFVPQPRQPGEQLTNDWKPDLRILAEFPLTSVIPLVPFFDAIYHCIMAAARRSDVEFHTSGWRWMPWAISLSFSHFVMAQIGGVMDFHLLMCLTSLVCIYCWCLYQSEDAHHRGARNESNLWLQTAISPIGVYWVLMSSYFWMSVQRGSMPRWSYVIWFLHLLFDVGTLAVFYFEKLKHNWLDFAKVVSFECSMSFLFLVFSQLFCWVSFLGMLRY